MSLIARSVHLALTLVPLMPGLHSGFSIPTVPNGGNHTSAFTEAASTIQAHEACIDVSKALAAVGMRVLTDEAFLSKANSAFEEAKGARGDSTKRMIVQEDWKKRRVPTNLYD
ncbi:hypothetical protein BKA82DRAFT_836379 [Pisolithus tinctorius]|nr:hypothetical protein BKA82DRAFT_836379 [Pisolithus tinctorius]